MLAEASPKDGTWGPALYNRSVCLELLERFDEAVLGYDLLVRADVFAVDARFRRGLAQASLGNLKAARRDFVALRPQVEGGDRLVVDVQIGSLDARLGKARAAAARLGPTIDVLRQRSTDHPAEGWYLAQALVAMGDLHGGAAARIPLRLNVPPRVGRRLARRAERLEIAQGFWAEATAHHEPTWAAASMLHLGEAYLALALELAALRTQLQALPRLSDARQVLNHWLATQIPNIGRKARDGLRLCELVYTETALDDPSTRACRLELEAFPEQLLQTEDP